MAVLLVGNKKVLNKSFRQSFLPLSAFPYLLKKSILSNFRAQGSLHVSQLNQIWYSIKFSVFLQILYLFKLPTIKSYVLTLSLR